jgi:hypothetical protein
MYQTLIRVGLMITTVLGAAVLSGCELHRTGGIVAIGGMDETPPRATAVDVDNRLGTVRIVADPKLDHPVVRAVARGNPTESEGHWTAATMSDEGGHPVLRVLSTGEGNAANPPTIDIVVLVPECTGVRVRNEGGRVTLVDVHGAVDVQTSIPGNGDQAIVVNTKFGLRDPLMLHAERGGIELRMGFASAGLFSASAPKGVVTVDAAQAKVQDVRSTRLAWTAQLNDGTSDLKVEADDGNISVIVGR